jgi:hypothetical protein
MLHPDTARRVRDASQSASRASIALTLTGLVHALHAGVLTSLAFFLRALDRDELMSDAVARRIDDLSQGTATAALVAMFVCAAAFLQWLYRFVTASARLAPEGARLPSPGAAAFAFFVPVMNLYAPLRDLRALHAALDVTELPEAPPKPHAFGASGRARRARRRPRERRGRGSRRLGRAAPRRAPARTSPPPRGFRRRSLGVRV